MDLTFQVPIIIIYSIRLSLPDTVTTKRHFCFGPAVSFFLELLVIELCSSPVAYWIPSYLRGSSSSIMFLPFHTVHGVLAAKYWSDLLFSPPVDHVLSEFSTLTHPSCVALHGMTHSFIELHKPLLHDTAVIHKGVVSPFP